MSRRTLVSTLAASLVAAIPAPGQRVPLGGPATVADCSPNAFGFPLPMLDAAQRRAFSVGNSFFRQNWIEAPASASARDGLGPLFNAASCSACHLKDGRGAPPTAFEGATGLLIRLGVPAAGGPDQPHPVYGGQLQDRGVRGLSGEARVVIEEEFVSGRYGDGTPFELVRPVYRFEAWADGAPGDDLAIGPRIGQQLIVAEFADGTVAIFLFAATGFERSQAAEFAFDTDVTGVCHFDNFASHTGVVFVIGRCLAVFLQRAVHHHAGEAIFDGGQAGLGAIAVILVHDNRDVRIQFGRRDHQMTQVGVLGVSPSTPRCLNDHGRVGFIGGFHDRLDLFHIVDVECCYAVVVLCGVVEHNAKWNQCHVQLPWGKMKFGRQCFPGDYRRRPSDRKGAAG
jgi:hypothetical protein